MTVRACHVLEIEPAYCDVVVERLQNFTARKHKKDNAMTWINLVERLFAAITRQRIRRAV
jgi:hypothetical protein